ncbi:hypothetical protein ACH5RR_029851 [Cinchona calisaya]|uniref:RNase H type-1 domain-containing protein n=1 Tax=Cinchona calisaya TaxID=153742 RepID=A0ABD2YWE6_9GENT
MALRYLHKELHVVVGKLTSFSSPIWKRMMNIKDVVECNMVSLVMDGTSSFWFEDCSHEGSLFSKVDSSPIHDISIANAWTGHYWNEDAILASFPSFNMNLLVGKTILLGNGKDHVSWKGMDNGRRAIRDDVGNLLETFSSYYPGYHTNLFVELKAVLDGIQLCNRLQLHMLIIELDSRHCNFFLVLLGYFSNWMILSN